MAAERETVDRLIAHHLADRIGADLRRARSPASPGRACSSSSPRPAPTASCRPPPSAPITTASRRAATRLSASARARRYRLGDQCRSSLVEAAPVAGALRFELLSDGRITAKPGKGRRGAKAPSRAADAAHGKTRPRTSESRSRKDGRGGKAGGPAPPEHKASREKTPRGKITPRVKGERARRRNDETRRDA